jgi:hypothetical protein
MEAAYPSKMSATQPFSHSANTKEQGHHQHLITVKALSH